MDKNTKTLILEISGEWTTGCARGKKYGLKLDITASQQMICLENLKQALRWARWLPSAAN